MHGIEKRAQQRASVFDAGYPATEPILHQQRERAMVVDVECGPGDERHASFPAQLHRGEVVRLDHAAAVVDEALECAEFRLGFDQRER